MVPHTTLVLDIMMTLPLREWCCNCIPDASLVPASAAPTPTHGSLNTDPNADAADVFNIFSDHYPNSILWCPDNEARAGWSAGGLRNHMI